MKKMNITQQMAKLLKWQGTQAELARVAVVSRVAVRRWLVNGAIGKGSAFVLAALPGCPLTLTDMRGKASEAELADAQVKAAKLRVKQSLAYIKQRDRALNVGG